MVLLLARLLVLLVASAAPALAAAPAAETASGAISASADEEPTYFVGEAGAWVHNTCGFGSLRAEVRGLRAMGFDRAARRTLLEGGSVDLYRAVGVREFEDVMATGLFRGGGASLEGRQFAFTMEEALKYANTDVSKVAILRATVRGRSLSAFDFSRSIDPHIFRNGVITVQPGLQSQIFHEALLGITHAF